MVTVSLFGSSRSTNNIFTGWSRGTKVEECNKDRSYYGSQKLETLKDPKTPF